MISRTLPVSRAVAAAAALVAAGLADRPAAGQTPPTPDFTWNNFTGGTTTWSTAANWTPAGPPAGGIDRVLGFGSSPLQTAGGYTSTYNLGAFDLNSLVLTSAGASNPSVVLTGGAAADTLRFNTSAGSTLPSVWQQGTGRVIVQNGTATSGVTLNNGTTLQLLGDGVGELQLNATVTQTGTGNSGLLVNQTGTRPMFTGSLVRLAGTNTFAGGVNLTAGNLVIANNSALGTGTFTVNGGTVRFDPAAAASFTVANAITLNGTMVITGANTAATTTTPTPIPIATFSGPIGGTGGVTFSNSNTGVTTTGVSVPLVYAFTGANTFAGPVTIQPMGNTTVTATFGTDTVAAGTAAGSSGFSVFSNSSLTFDNRAGVATRLNTTTPPALTLNRGNLNLFGNAAENAAETFGTLTVSGTGAVNVLGNSAATQTTTVTFGGLSRPSNGTLAFTGTNLGSGSGTGESVIRFATDPGGSVGGGGGAGTVTRSILPYAYADSAPSTAGAAAAPVLGLVRWDAGTQRILPLNPATEYSTNLFLTRNDAPTSNHRYASTATAPSTSGVAGLVGSTTVNALVLDTNTAATNRVGVSVEGPGTLTVAGGAILSATNGAASQPTNAGMVNVGVLNFGSIPGYVHTVGNLTINSPIIGSGGVVKSGFGTLTLNGANAFTGGLTVNSGAIQFASDANLGAAGQPVTLNSGSGVLSGGGLQFLPNTLFGPATATAETVNRPITVGPAGTNITVPRGNNTLTLAGPISGGGQIFKNGAGILTLTGTNTFTGNVVVNAGTLAVPTDAALGDPSSNLILSSAAAIQPTASFTSNRTILMTSSNPFILVDSGVSWTVSGNFTSQTTAATPLKDGPGDLVLTGVSTFTGGYQNGISGPAVRGTATAAFPNSGRTILTGPNGSMPLAASVLAIANGEVVLDNSTAVNNNRVGSVTLGLIGGNARLIGNSSAPVNEAVGALSINNANNQYGGTLTLETPAGSGQSTTLTATAFANQAAPNVGTLFVRGTNLGAATGDRTAVVFAANPAQTNGLIPAMVGATSATSDPTDFLTTTPTGGQFALVPFANYSPTPLSGAGNAAATYDVTAPATAAGVSAANALRVRGGSVDLGGSTLTLTSGAVLATGGANGDITNGSLAYAAGVPARFAVATGSDLTVSAAVSGTTGGLVKTGGGVLTLAAPVSMTSGLIGVGQGTLRYGIADALPTTTGLFVNSGATLDLNGHSSTLAAVIGYGNVNLGAGDLTLDSTTLPTQQFGGALSGTGAFIKRNTNTFTLNGNSPSFTGGVQILGGNLTVNSGTALGSGTSPILLGDTTGTNQAVLTLGAAVSSFGRDITVQAGSTPGTPHTIFAGANTVAISGNISLGQLTRLNSTAPNNVTAGTATLTGTISGPGGLFVFLGNWSLWGSNTYSGGTTLDMGPNTTGTVGVGTDSALGTGPVTVTSAGGFLRADNGTRTLANPITLQSGAYFGVCGTNDLTLNGAMDLSGATQTLNVISTGTTTLGGAVGNGTGLVKNGPGVLAVTGNNTYTGTTTVNAGTLLVNNATGSGTGQSGVAVNAGAVLGGTGTVGDGGARTVTVNTLGVVRPGGGPTGIGTLTVNSTGNVTFAPGSILQVNVGSGPTTGGRLNVTGGGTTDLSGLSASAPMVVYLTDAGGLALGTPYSLRFLDTGSAPITFPGGGFDPNLFSVIANFDLTAVSIVNPSSGALVVNFTPVPEPVAVLGLAAAAVGLARVTRSIRRRPASTG